MSDVTQGQQRGAGGGRGNGHPAAPLEKPRIPIVPKDGRLTAAWREDVQSRIMELDDDFD